MSNRITGSDIMRDLGIVGNGQLTEGEREVAGLTTNEATSMVGRIEVDGHEMPGYDGKRSDGEFILSFDSSENAQVMYEFFVDNGLLIPGEIDIFSEGVQHSVHFAPVVMQSKPELLYTAMAAFEELAADEDQFESAMEEIGELLMEKAKKGNAAKFLSSVDFNGVHGKKGKFVGLGKVKRQKGGSFSDGQKRRLKATVKGKSVSFGSTKRPCGREARKQGKDIRCYDGKNMAKESVEERFAEILSEAGTKKKVSFYGADGFNPLHGKDGKFTSIGSISRRKGGSLATKSRLNKAKVSGKKISFVSTKAPCGRKARSQGKNIRCWDGQVMEEFDRLAQILRLSQDEYALTTSDKLFVANISEAMGVVEEPVMEERGGMSGLLDRLESDE